MIWFNRFIAWFLPVLPKSWVGLVARQYIAGEELDAAVSVSLDLNAQGSSVTLDLLGEDPSSREQCLRAVETYEKVLERIADAFINGGISLKPSHMGLKIDDAFCRENIRRLLERAATHGIFVRIDMEDASLCDPTLELFKSLASEFSNVGIVLQAYLRRSVDDINIMLPKNGGQSVNVRLCKGAYYWEKRSTVYKNPDVVNRSYTFLLEKLFSAGAFVGIATHDERLVFEALRLVDRMEIPAHAYEFQMLYGVEDELRKILLAQGHPVRVYVPFGRELFAYSLRRLRENPQMVGHVMGNMGSLIRSQLVRSRLARSKR